MSRFGIFWSVNFQEVFTKKSATMSMHVMVAKFVKSNCPKSAGRQVKPDKIFAEKDEQEGAGTEKRREG